LLARSPRRSPAILPGTLVFKSKIPQPLDINRPVIRFQIDLRRPFSTPFPRISTASSLSWLIEVSVEKRNRRSPQIGDLRKNRVDKMEQS